MDINYIFAGRSVTPVEISRCQSARSERQKKMLQFGGASLVSVTINIPGTIKQFPMARQAFQSVWDSLIVLLPKSSILQQYRADPDTGSEGMLLLSLPPQKVKQTAVQIKSSHPLGQLFDIDVFDQNGRVISYSESGLEVRSCIFCEDKSKICARSQTYSCDKLQAQIAYTLEKYCRKQTLLRFSTCVLRALLYEVSTTPKPGLVDRNNSGAHHDMDFFTFLDSSAALSHCFEDMFLLGWKKSHVSAENQYLHLQQLGLEAEKTMYHATGGVNTHKGLIFSIGILSAAFGRCCAIQGVPVSTKPLVQFSVELGQCAIKQATLEAQTTKQIRSLWSGARGQVAKGFPQVFQVGLPMLQHYLAQNLSINDAASLTLLHLIANTNDTNMIRRGGKQCSRFRKREAELILQRSDDCYLLQSIFDLDQSYIQENISPGGCADILALTLLFYILEKAGLLTVDEC